MEKQEFEQKQETPKYSGLQVLALEVLLDQKWELR
jgi:hypothetical protein